MTRANPPPASVAAGRLTPHRPSSIPAWELPEGTISFVNRRSGKILVRRIPPSPCVRLRKARNCVKKSSRHFRLYARLVNKNLESWVFRARLARHPAGEQLDFPFLKLSETSSGKRDAGGMGCPRNGLEEAEDRFCEGCRVMQNPVGHLPFAPPRRDPAFEKPFNCGKQWSLGPTRKKERCLAGSTGNTKTSSPARPKRAEKRFWKSCRFLTSGRLESSNTAAGYGPALVTVLPSSANTRRTEKCFFSMASAQEELQPSPFTQSACSIS